MYRFKYIKAGNPSVTVTMTVPSIQPVVGGLLNKNMDIVSVMYRPHCMAQWEPVEGFN